MASDQSQWDNIFKRNGHVYTEPAPPVIAFAALLKESKARTVLDVGCGTGRHVVCLAKQGLQVTGLDSSPTGLKLSHSWLEAEGIKSSLVHADARSPFPLSDQSFDALISTQVIHHALLDSIQLTAVEIARVVRPGGLIFVSVPVLRVMTEDGWASKEIEPGTYIPLDGDEAGLPHHFFKPDELSALFPTFKVLELRIIAEKIIALTGVKTD